MGRKLGWIMALLVALATVVGAGCATREQTGTLVGAGAGGVLGQVLTDSRWGALLGAAVGGFIGREVGQEMDERDRERMGYVLRDVPEGQEYGWLNPNTGTYWEATPLDTYESRNGTQCRDFAISARTEAESDATRGTACLTPDGTWEMAG
jgi:surface antigen